MAPETETTVDAPAAPAPIPAPAPAPAPEAPKPEAAKPEAAAAKPDAAKPPEAKPEANVVEQAPAEPLPLTVPEFVPLAERTPEREALVSGFQQVAADAGLERSHPGMAQGLLDQAIEAATMLQYEPPDAYTTPEDTFAQMTRMFGEEQARSIVTAAQTSVARFGPKVEAWLAETGLGLDVAVLVALAQSGFASNRRTPEQAQKDLDAAMQTKEFLRGDKLMVLKVAALSRIAHGKTENESLRALEQYKAKTAREEARKAGADKLARETLEAELRELAKAKHMTRAEADRFMELTRRLTGGEN